MTISLHLEAANVQELQRMCAELAHSGAPPSAVAAIAETVQTVDPMAKARAAKAAKTSKAAETVNKPDDAAKPAEDPKEPAVSPPVAPGPSSAGDSPSVDDMTAKLRELSSAKGLPAVTAILKDFGAQRVKEVKTTDYAGVIAKVDAALAG